MIKNILVVCEGNICRSPMAQGLLASHLPKVRVMSAGLAALAGRPADPIAVQLMEAKGVDISGHIAAALSLEHVRLAQLILAMTQAQRKSIELMYPFTKGKVYRMAEHEAIDVVDPYRKGMAVFQASLDQIESGLARWLHSIARLTYDANGY
ncbi:low molecular weight protein-tyrosine-phosphatase [Paraburkholderia sediminicola]|uniref:low molecular weight protein-tyrosine-phosphatase n=1 Tax=Paraburkholderia sediminicola TaxID=458836 RepID=UPI0038BCB735